MHETRGASLGQIDLGDISIDDGLAHHAHARQEHFHLSNSSVLSFIENDKSIVEGSTTHVSQWDHLDDLSFEVTLDLVVVEDLVESIV